MPSSRTPDTRRLHRSRRRSTRDERRTYLALCGWLFYFALICFVLACFGLIGFGTDAVGRGGGQVLNESDWADVLGAL